MSGKTIHHKALLIPINEKREIFIQDRRGYRSPDWGFFGGGIEVGETPLTAVIRETQEELLLSLSESDLMYLGEFYTEYEDEQIWRHIYLYQTEQVVFAVQEGKGGRWVTYAEAKQLLLAQEYFDDLSAAIDKVLG